MTSPQVRSQKGHLVVKLKENETYKKFVEQQLDKEQQKYSTLLKQYEELKSSFGADDIQKEIHKLEGSVDDVRATIDKIELVKMQWTEMVCKQYSVITTSCIRMCSYLSTVTRKHCQLMVNY